MEELRAQFPVLERVAYLNAGTNGPVPRRAFEAVEASLREQVERGRSSREWFEHQIERIDELRGRAATLLGAETGRRRPHRLHHGRRQRRAPRASS